MVKIIFSDFDNTMLDYYSEDNYFDEYKISTLEKLQGKGIKFCIVTGRSVSFFKRFPNLLNVIDYIIGSNGACIYDVKNDNYISCDSIKVEDFDDVINYLIDNDYDFLLNCKDKRYCYGGWYASGCLNYEKNNEYLCDQIIFRVKKIDFDMVFKRLENIKEIKINNMSNWDEYWSIDVNNSNVSKGKSVRWLCDYLNIEMNDTIAFGDGANDKSMFEVVDKGIAVGNAVDKLKIISKSVALDCKDSGIYKYIEENILK